MSSSPAKVYGGKQKLADQLVPHFPAKADCYVEAFGGSFAVLFAVPENLYKIRVVSDISRGIYSFFKVIRERFQDLSELCELTPYSIDQQRACRDTREDPQGDGPEEELQRAWRTWVRMRMNYGSRTMPGAGFIGGNSNRSNAAEAMSRLADFQEVSRRLQGVEICNLPAAELIERYSSAGAFHYLDPPYFPDSRASNNDYENEMTVKGHEELLAKVKVGSEAGALFTISGYSCEFYEDHLRGWRRVEFEHRAQSITKGDITRTEILWMNYPARLELQRRWGEAVRPKTAREKLLLKTFRAQGAVR